jgi:hypothetical protein
MFFLMKVTGSRVTSALALPDNYSTSLPSKHQAFEPFSTTLWCHFRIGVISQPATRMSPVHAALVFGQQSPSNGAPGCEYYHHDSTRVCSPRPSPPQTALGTCTGLSIPLTPAFPPFTDRRRGSITIHTLIYRLTSSFFFLSLRLQSLIETRGLPSHNAKLLSERRLVHSYPIQANINLSILNDLFPKL